MSRLAGDRAQAAAIRDGAARDLILAASRVLRGDELEVLAQVAQGMAHGRKVYGYLDVDRDQRDMAGEALEEVRDALVYVGAALVKHRRAR